MTALASTTRPNFDVEAIRADFPILHQQINGHDLVFLDTAASAQKPRQVIQAMVDVMENDYANVHRGVYPLSQRATDKFEAARSKAAKFINAPDEDAVIFSRGATEGINLVAASYGQRLGPGDEIITTELEHHSNIVPWQIIAEKQGAKVLFAPAAFTKVTGEAHWHGRQRPRAIENGCVVISAAQGGTHAGGRQTYGHSVIVAPWGEVLADGGTDTGYVTAEIDMAKVATARQSVPSLNNDRAYSLTG